MPSHWLPGLFVMPLSISIPLSLLISPPFLAFPLPFRSSTFSFPIPFLILHRVESIVFSTLHHSSTSLLSVLTVHHPVTHSTNGNHAEEKADKKGLHLLSITISVEPPARNLSTQSHLHTSPVLDITEIKVP